MDSWKELAKAGTIKLLITVFFGGALCICLKAWEGFRTPIALSIEDVRVFNALTIGLSLCMGLNLLSSLRRYAVILRWAILTKRYVSMEAFDLILGIDELTNVVKLMALSLPSLRKRKWLMGKTRDWVDMNPGTNQWYVYACALWLLVNMGSQVLVASLSLFWPMQPFDCQLTKYGNVSVADLSGWLDESKDRNSWETAWRYGMDAQSWPTFATDESHTDLSKLPGTPIYRTPDNKAYEYRFFYRNPELLYSDYNQSDRCIRTRVECEQYVVVGDVQSNLNETEPEMRRYIMARRPESQTAVPVPIPMSGPGMITYVSFDEACGSGDNPRCSAIDVLQYRDDDDAWHSNVTKSSLWRCKNTVDPMNGCQTEGLSHPGIDVNDKRLYSNDAFAQFAAGAIGWTGVTEYNITDRQFRVYPQGTPWSPNKTISTTEIEQIIMRFTIGAIAAFDDHGIRYNITINNHVCDKNSQRLNVSWRYVGSILAGIGFIQSAALLYLLIRANRTIVRDASSFSTAMLLKPVLEAIGGEPGLMALSGEQLKDHPRLRFRKIKYGYEDAQNGVRQIKVLFQQGEDDSRLGKWPSGEYR
ncbi:hypothetical protein N0V86_005753 [Didymella sp. IMI 355093]|nr:hypothetical protein N0V86_005753 [Didymella sp. IMI 355093]